MYNSGAGVSEQDYNEKTYGFSVRLIRPATPTEIGELSDGDFAGYYTQNDGRKIRTVYINEQVWTSENLADTKFRNGDYIQGWNADGLVVISNPDWVAATTAMVCAYENDPSNI